MTLGLLKIEYHLNLRSNHTDAEYHKTASQTPPLHWTLGGVREINKKTPRQWPFAQSWQSAPPF